MWTIKVLKSLLAIHLKRTQIDQEESDDSDSDDQQTKNGICIDNQVIKGFSKFDEEIERFEAKINFLFLSAFKLDFK